MDFPQIAAKISPFLSHFRVRAALKKVVSKGGVLPRECKLVIDLTISVQDLRDTIFSKKTVEGENCDSHSYGNVTSIRTPLEDC